MKPILVLDFDGVIHSYSSGWKGARSIPDPPVPGALEFIIHAMDYFEVAILSSRSHQFGGRRAMKKWLYKNLCKTAATYDITPTWLMRHIHMFADPWPDQVNWDMRRLVNKIKWPKHKPPAVITIDDRALTFTGKWPEIDQLKSFKPWNK
jgi:hypothetical protein